MKVVILKDTPKVGKKDEVKNFPDGYARNMLFPKGIALPATPALLAEIEKRKTLIKVEKEIREDLLDKSLEALRGVRLVIKRKVNEKGHLFSSIHAEDIITELKNSLRVEIAHKALKLDEPLKAVGEYTLNVEIGGKKSHFLVVIEAL